MSTRRITPAPVRGRILPSHQRHAADLLRRRRAVARSAVTFIAAGFAASAQHADPQAAPVDFVAAGLAWSAPDDSEEE
jgi:hypothetical protein